MDFDLLLQLDYNNTQMVQLFRVDQVALTLLQVVGLLFPVVLLTLRYLAEHELEAMSEAGEEKTLQAAVLMIFLLSAIGFLASLSIIFSTVRVDLIRMSVLAMAVFFLAYGYLIFVTVTD